MLKADEMFMGEAIRQARIAAQEDEVPVGAVIVHKRKIIAKAHNQIETLKDPTAHAEMIAITQATNYLSSKCCRNVASMLQSSLVQCAPGHWF